MSARRASSLSSVGLALLSALLVRLALPAFDLAPLIFVAWVPLIVISALAPPRTALLLGLLQGLALGLFAHGWLVLALLRNFATPVWGAGLALFAVALLVGLRSALVAWGVAFLRRSATPAWLSFPLLHLAAESLLPGAFPWTNALAVSSLPIWQQAAAFGGAAAVSAWLCLVNGLLAEAWLVRHSRKPRSLRSLPARLFALSIGLIAVMTAFGLAVMRAENARITAAPHVRVGLAHYDSSLAPTDPVSTLRALSLAEQQANGAPDLWVWPETVVGTPYTRRGLIALQNDYLRRDRVREPSDSLKGPLLVGAVLDERGTLENSAVLFGTSGLIDGVYSKHVLMPVGETSALPLGLTLPSASLQRATPFRPGADAPALTVQGHPLALSICYEDILADYVFEQAQKNRAELLVNLTSDRWFKGTAAVDFHFALARLRAVEERKFLLRSTRDGVSGVVDSAGRVVVRLSGQHSAVVGVTVPLLSGPALAGKRSRELAVLFPLAAAALLLFGVIRRAKHEPPVALGGR